LIAKKNEENKKLQNASSANFILSTIHSAKGLEFENVVVMFRNENDLPEDKKRMYYVALTRAMKSEFILAYDTSKSPQIEADYKAIVHKLKEKKNAVTATTVSP
jgi:DNA helicase-2/ATP-dependent DNA helicase PcrA